MAGRYALLIGNSEYSDPGLRALNSPAADVSGLQAVLSDPRIGGFEVEVLLDRTDDQLRKPIARFFTNRKPGDVLLLYYSGHGLLNDFGRLFLATHNTERDLLSGTAVPTDFVKDEMTGSRSRSKVLILDCCHAGAFSGPVKGSIGSDVQLGDRFGPEGTGQFVMASSRATQFAWEGQQLLGAAPPSIYTAQIIHAFKTGDADTEMEGVITIDSLQRFLERTVPQQNPHQSPCIWTYGQNGQIKLAHNVVSAQSLAAWQRRIARQREKSPELADLFDRATGELAQAGRMQAMLGPASAGNSGPVNWASASQPRRHLNGDFMGVVPAPDGRVHFFLGDVTGSGGSSALIAIVLQTTLLELLRAGVPVSEIISTANRRIDGLQNGKVAMFASMFIGTLDPASNSATVFDAGHGYAWLISSRGEASRINVAGGGPPLGVAADAEFEPVQIHMSPGDRLLLTSDGILECLGPGGDQFGWDRLSAAVRGSTSVPTDVEQILVAVRAFVGETPSADDTSLLSIGLAQA